MLITKHPVLAATVVSWIGDSTGGNHHARILIVADVDPRNDEACETAALMFDKRVEDVTPAERQQAKVWNFTQRMVGHAFGARQLVLVRRLRRRLERQDAEPWTDLSGEA